MDIVFERASILAYPATDELVVVMDGFRIILTGEEACALAATVISGLQQLYPERVDARTLDATTAPEARVSDYAKPSEGGAEFKRRLDALIGAARQYTGGFGEPSGRSMPPTS
jgi:hypothetical protein